MNHLLWKLLKTILFLFDAERVHHWMVRRMKAMKRPPRLLIGNQTRLTSNLGPIEVSGVRFLSRVGLAAGFDKNAELLEKLPQLGFGFAEVGTVTLKPQPGNPKPRIFRDSGREALFNRLGFNNDGAEVVSKRLKEAKPKLPDGFAVGVNIGKNKTTAAEDASEEYGCTASFFKGLCEYLVINVSSPNTPGLRDLQKWESIRSIFGSVRDEVSTWENSVPIFVKFAPEVVGDDLKQVVQGLEQEGVSGFVLTNTLGSKRNINGEVLPGGISGRPLTKFSEESLVNVRELTQLPVISVGGIFSKKDAEKRLSLGADLIQIYTGWIYQGPSFPFELASIRPNKS